MSKNTLAMKVSKHFHSGQKYGEYDYYDYHVCGVAKLVETYCYSKHKDLMDDAITVAYLHDTVEDTPLTFRSIEIMFGSNICEAINAITYRKGVETRDEYYIRVSKNELATIVKLNDAIFNSDECKKVGRLDKMEYYNLAITKILLLST